MIHRETLRDRVVIEHGDAGVTRVCLDRPDKRNGLDVPMFEALVEAGSRLAADARVRAVVLSGEGPAFCAGLDFKAVMTQPKAARGLLVRPEGKVANIAQQMCWT